MELFFIVAAGLMLIVLLVFLLAFGRLFRLWLMCFLSGAPVPLPIVLMMTLRKTPAELICKQRIKARHAGVDLTAAQLERAYLQGADVEKMVDAMLLAHRTGREVTWEQLVETELADG